MRGYHGDMIPEKKFKRWYLPQRLPDVRIRKTDLGKKQEEEYLKIKADFANWSSRPRDVAVEEKRVADETAGIAQTPLGSLMFIEVERRLDTFIFRCCFAPSVYQARQMVIHGKVLVNGYKVGQYFYYSRAGTKTYIL